MDKFRELQNKIESVIKNIDQQIKDKKDKINSIQDEVYNIKINIGELTTTIENNKSKKDKLSVVANKSIIFYISKKIIKELLDEAKESFKQRDKEGILISVAEFITLIIVLSFIITNPILLLIMPYAYLILLCSSIKEILSLRKIKKENTLSSLEEEIKNAENKAVAQKANLEKCNIQIKQLESEIATLQSEKAYYEKELNKIIETRENAIAQLAMPLLDEVYNQIDTHEVTVKIRARGKEGTNNG